MSADLLPCPFCGGAPDVLKIGNEHTRMAVTIRCPTCRVERTDATPKSRNHADHGWLLETATKNWNRRAPVQAQGVCTAVLNTAKTTEKSTQTRMDAGPDRGAEQAQGVAPIVEEIKRRLRGMIGNNDLYRQGHIWSLEMVGIVERDFSIQPAQGVALPAAESRLPPITLDSIATYPSPHGTLIRRADVECMLSRAAALAQAPQPVAGPAQQDDARDARIRDAIAKEIGDLYYCGRVWEAWGVGTMSQDDFTQVDQMDEILDNVTNAAIAALTGSAG